MNSYILIGLGRFGAEMAAKLYECGEEVLAIDYSFPTPTLMPVYSARSETRSGTAFSHSISGR